MKAIKITQQLKDSNPKLFQNLEVGVIYPFNPPKKFGIGDKVVHGFDKNDALQTEQGFKTLLRPDYDADLQKYGNIVESGADYTYEILDLTDEEKKAKIKENADVKKKEKIDKKLNEIVEEELQSQDDANATTDADGYPFWEDYPDKHTFELDFKVQYLVGTEYKLFKALKQHDKKLSEDPLTKPTNWVQLN